MEPFKKKNWYRWASKKDRPRRKNKFKKEFIIDSVKNESFSSNNKIDEFKSLLFNDFPFY